MNYLQTAKHAPEQIIDQVLMKNFCLLKELTADEPTLVQKRDYIISKYLKLIYICSYCA